MIFFKSVASAYRPESKHHEVSLEPGVDGEAACRRVHAGEEDDVVNVFETQLGAVIPVLIVHPLSDQSVRLHRPVLINLTTSCA